MKIKTHKIQTLFNTEVREAVYSSCEAYRFCLDILWSRAGSLMTWIMLNPSTATELKNDPTIERCCRRAKVMGYSGVRILNLFAYRATDPSDMKTQEEPIGEHNDIFIREALAGLAGNNVGDLNVYCGWGAHGSHLDRSEDVLAMIKSSGCVPMALRMTSNGQPFHPLYVSYDQEFKKLVPADE